MNKKLSSGVAIPEIGFGTYPLKGDILNEAIVNAYLSGYRMFDTSDNYGNEKDLGIALLNLYRKNKVSRDELFLISKISDELYPSGSLVGGGAGNKGKFFWKTSELMQHPNAVHDIVFQKVNNSIELLNSEYLDLLLLHWPYPDYFEEIWYEMQKIYESGKVKAIGVCNCYERHLQKLKDNNMMMPVVNQIETSPLNTKLNLINYCKINSIQIMVYSPLRNLQITKNQNYIDYLGYLAGKYDKTIQQIVLIFDIQRGLIPIPKSKCIARINENIDVFDIQLLPEEMDMLLSFNINLQTLPESKACPGF